MALALTLAVAGCAGYRWVGANAPGAADAGPLAVGTFTNETLEPYLGPLVTATVRSRLLERGVTVDGAAPRRLSGRITGFSDDVLAFNADGIANHRRIVITTAVDLADGDRAVWTGRSVTASAEYPVTADSTANRDAKDRALEQAAVDLADGFLLDLTTPGEAP